jgi:hypothetical protein
MNLPINGTSALAVTDTPTVGLFPVYEWALSQGLSPVPCHPDYKNSKGKRGKTPSISAEQEFPWKKYQD